MIARPSFAAIGAVLITGTAFTVPPARAERLIVSVSNHRVTVTPNYSGEELVLFGSVEKDASTPSSRTSYDLVVTVSGPRATPHLSDHRVGASLRGRHKRPVIWRE